MINKKRFNVLNRITLTVMGILVLLLLTRTVFTSFYTDSNGTVVNHIAFYVLDSHKQTETLKMFDIKPDSNDYTYEIDVSNFKNGKVSEVDLNVNLSIRTTTNLPVSYALYLEDDNTNILGDREVIQDSNNVYYFKYNPPGFTFTHGVQKTNHYRLTLNFPSSYNNEAYQDLIDSIEITLNANQV